MKKELIILFVMVLFLVGSVSANPIPNWPQFYESFEEQTIDTEWEDGNVLGLDSNDGIANGADCTFYIRDDVTAREGSQYWDLRCTWVSPEIGGDTCWDGYGRYGFERATMRLEGDELTRGYGFDYNNGTEYWIGWSTYIPVDYDAQVFHSNMFQMFQSGSGYSFALFMGGDEGDWKTALWYDSSSSVWEYDGGDWEIDKGTWVDFVLHARLYTSNSAGARFRLYKNGVLIAGSSRDNLRNMRYDTGNPYFDWQNYNWWQCGDSTDANCADTADDYYNCDTSGWYRSHAIDALRINEYTSGQGNHYCDVAPAVWSQTPNITYPANGGTGLNSTFIAVYNGYIDHRTDAQDCFAYNATQIQVDEAGSNWSNPVYDSVEVGDETSHEISGLNINTNYQIRVRHKSARSGSSDTYWGEWSDTIYFSTGTNPSISPYSIIKTSSPPTINGDISEFNNAHTITLTNSRGTYGDYKLMWDDNALYIAASVSDTQLNADETIRDGSLWNDDSIEMIFDTLHDAGSSMQSDDYKFIINLLNVHTDSKAWDNTWNMSFSSDVVNSGTVNQNSDIDTGYIIEVAIPWLEWGVSAPTENDAWGFELSMNDQDETNTTMQTTWSNTDGGTMNNPDGWGNIIFSAGTNCGNADSNTDGSVSITELINYITQWKSGEITITELIAGIGEWKNGCS